jgi:excisionase family DNA binding protein
MKPTAKKTLALAEVCNLLGISRKTFYNWEDAGKIPKPRRDPMSNYRVFSLKDIDKLKKVTGRR